MQESLFTVAKLEDFVSADYPLRPLRELVNEALKRRNGLFNLIYADTGRASIAPETLIQAVASHADGMAERAQALRLLERTPGRQPKTVGADKVYDTRDFVAACRARNATPHVARMGEDLQRSFMEALAPEYQVVSQPGA